MDCKCFKDLGCFMTDEIIDFGVEAYCDGDFVFEIRYRGRTELQTVTFVAGDPIVLPYTFDEIGTVKIKIKVPQGDALCSGSWFQLYNFKRWRL